MKNMTNSTHSSRTSLSKASPFTESSSKCSRSAKGSHFVKALERSNIDLTRCEDLKVQEIKRILDLMERPRESPAPDSEFFHQTRRTILHENKAQITMDLSPLLLVLRKLPSNNHKTENLLYRVDAQWYNWGSTEPENLPAPKPDFYVCYKHDAFDPDLPKQMTSPYLDEKGYALFDTWSQTFPGRGRHS